MCNHSYKIDYLMDGLRLFIYHIPILLTHIFLDFMTFQRRLQKSHDLSISVEYDYS